LGVRRRRPRFSARSEILAELPALSEQIAAGTLGADARAIPLADVEQAWAIGAGAGQRLVLTPSRPRRIDRDVDKRESHVDQEELRVLLSDKAQRRTVTPTHQRQRPSP
jgi:hypothetical protein